MPAPNFPQRILRPLLMPLASAADRLGGRFHLALAALLALVAAVAIHTGATAGLQNKAYDLIVKSRLRVPAPDLNIVILDIDEPALAAMAREFGRWPWPRQVMGEIIDGIATQKPAAIVFDITFADPDVYNPESDRYLGETVARHPNVFFPLIRLDPESDSLSELKLAQLPGVRALSDAAPKDATVAAVVPYFLGSLSGARIGTNNLISDGDGILRRYPVYRDDRGWRLDSLPTTVVASLGGALPESTDILVNWRGRPPAYPHVSFHEVYAEMQRSRKERAPEEFAGKIVIVGSTAASLFDFKATPVARTHPGVEVLATAIDNLKNGDALVMVPPLVSLAVTLLALALLSAAFLYNVDTRLVNLVFTLLQTGFLAVSYVVLNFSTLFVDLTVPFTFSLAYFAIARTHGMLCNYRRSGHPLFSATLDPGSECRVFLVECSAQARSTNARLRVIGDIKKHLVASRYGVGTPPPFKEVPLFAAFFRDRRLFYWLVPASDTQVAHADVLSALERAVAAAQKASRGYLRRAAHRLDFRLHVAPLAIDAEGTWREQGEQALAQLLALPRPALPEEKPPVAIMASREFEALCREQAPVAVPALLAEAGLNCTERRRKPRR